MNHAPGEPRFLGHPAGFSTLFFTELWERFSYYGMRAILVLFLVGAVSGGGMGLDDRTATAIYGLYAAGVYIASMPGGWVADRLLGAQRAVFWGGALIALGHAMLALARTPRAFIAGLAVIVLGTGLLKPNVSALVGELHRGDDARRDAAFTLFYMAINIGAALGPLVVALLAERLGWHVGFAAAAVGMAAGLAWFRLTQSRLGDTGLRPPGAPQGRGLRRHWLMLWAALAVVLLLAGLLWSGALQLSAISLQGGAMQGMAVVVIVYFAYLLFFAGLDDTERRGVLLLGVLILASTLFWAGYEQAGSSLTLFAERFTQRMIGGFEVPAGWFQSVPAVFVLICAPLTALLWTRLGARGRDLPVVVKFALGLAGMGLGFAVMVGAAKVLGGGALAGSGWLVLTYLLHTLGELCLSPVGMSATTRLAPKRFAGQAMGLWFTSLAMGNLFASRLAGGLEGAGSRELAAYFLRMTGWGIAGALLLLLLWPLLRRRNA
ncbi:MAG: peptide MFS transporter [Nevskiaceae bacterium]|nr:peptide MFS transporter [Nevskiaceae bacterium]